ncbi:MAG TPA: hypothetical protein VH877_07780 [Polyangia bacterium]|jgi:hypothetical protein|nr:hypothetical protein [Polyangia bacterium]
MSITHTLYLQEFYGISAEAAEHVPADIQRAYARALLFIAGTGGLSAAERAYFHAWQAACGHSQELIEEMRGFDPAPAELKEVLGVFISTSGRTAAAIADPIEGLKRGLVYDAIRLASADECYGDHKRNRVREMACLLGVSPEIVKALEGLVEIERAVRQTRLALLR